MGKTVKTLQESRRHFKKKAKGRFAAAKIKR